MPPCRQLRINDDVSDDANSNNQNGNQGRGRARVARGKAVGIRMRATISDFLKLDPLKFYGNEEASQADSWMHRMEQSLEAYGCDDRSKVHLAVYLLKDDAYDWWESVKALLEETQGVITGGDFKKAFLEEYFPKAERDSKVIEFFELKQGTMTVAEYAKKFSTLIRYAPWVARNMQEKMHRFLMGLKPQIYDRMVANRSNTYSELLDRAKLAESGLAAITQEISGGGTSSGKRPTPILQRTILKRIKGPSHQDYFAKAKCDTCGGNHHTSTYYRTTRACFRCAKKDHIAKDCTQPKPRPDHMGQQGHKVRTVRVIRRPDQNNNTNGG
ncbi:uncharacterized protein LOC142543146 [Primulina tabacum]|uniref:uncharacterized protein LOC142543146 n=1 Tax=Primulina tabacum TaxID=48773 RepID=UPI003F59EA52